MKTGKKCYKNVNLDRQTDKVLGDQCNGNGFCEILRRKFSLNLMIKNDLKLEVPKHLAEGQCNPQRCSGGGGDATDPRSIERWKCYPHLFPHLSESYVLVQRLFA